MDSIGCCQFFLISLLRRSQIGGHTLGYIHHNLNAKPIKHLKELAPLHGLAYALNLAQKVFAHTNTTHRIVLANLVCLAAARTTFPMAAALLMGIFMVNPHVYGGLAAKRPFLQEILINVRILCDRSKAYPKSSLSKGF